MSAHTKGPWKTETDLPFGEKPRVESNDKLICEVGNAERPHIAQDEWDANARLIAAAPELLEALKELLALTDDPKNDADPEESTFAFARSVIAKAEGRAASLPLSKGQEEEK